MRKEATKASGNLKLNRKTATVIAYRKSCVVTGTGLSHYILMDKKAKKA